MTEQRTLDWRPHFDPRSLRHRFTAIPFCTNLSKRRSIMRRKDVWLDQGQEGACTGFGAEHVRALSPRPQHTSNDLARSVYYEARRQDEWEGEDYEGSSVNGAMKALRHMGLIIEWRWAYNLDEADHGLSYHGAGELGVWWYSGMFNTDSNGFIHPTGGQVGGHALALAGYKQMNGGKAYRLENSWGPAWGDFGGAWIWAQDLEQLLRNDGELAFPMKKVR